MTTWTVQPSGGDYTTLAAALSNASTVANDIIEISGDWTSATDTTAATVADDNLIIRTAVGNQARHAGFDNGTTNYELAVTASSHCITVNNTGCTIDGLLILNNNMGSSTECIRMANDNGTLTIINTICRAANNTTQQDGIYAGAISCTMNLENVACMKFNRGGFHAQVFSGTHTQTWNFISCTAWDNGRSGSAGNGGFLMNAQVSGANITFNMQNCLGVGNDTTSAEDFTENAAASGTHTWDIHNSLSSDATISTRDTGAVNATENVTLVEGNPTLGQCGLIDITSAPFDPRLFDDPADNAPQDQHATAAGAGLTIGDFVTGTEDVAGTTRPVNTNYDIGFFEVPAAAGGLSIPVAMRSYRNLRVPV